MGHDGIVEQLTSWHWKMLIFSPKNKREGVEQEADGFVYHSCHLFLFKNLTLLLHA